RRRVNAFTYVFFPQVKAGDRQSGLGIYRPDQVFCAAFYRLPAVTQEVAVACDLVVFGHRPDDGAGLINLKQAPAWRELPAAVMSMEPGPARFLYSAGVAEKRLRFILEAGLAERVSDEGAVAAPGVAIASAGLSLAVEFGCGYDRSGLAIAQEFYREQRSIEQPADLFAAAAAE